MINYNYLFPRKFYSTFVNSLYPYFEWQRVPAHVCRNFTVVDRREVLLPTIFFEDENSTKPLPKVKWQWLALKPLPIVEWQWLALACGEWLSRRKYGRFQIVKLFPPAHGGKFYIFGDVEYNVAKQEVHDAPLLLEGGPENGFALYNKGQYVETARLWRPGVLQNED